MQPSNLPSSTTGWVMWLAVVAIAAGLIRFDSPLPARICFGLWAAFLIGLGWWARYRLVFRLVPELRHCQTDSEIDALYDKAKGGLRVSIVHSVAAALLVFMGFVAIAVAAIVLRPMGWWHSEAIAWLTSALFLITFVAWTFMGYHRLASVARRHLETTYGIRLCARCHYDLRGAPSPNCPECGEPIPAEAPTTDAARSADPPTAATDPAGPATIRESTPPDA